MPSKWVGRCQRIREFILFVRRCCFWSGENAEASSKTLLPDEAVGVGLVLSNCCFASSLICCSAFLRASWSCGRDFSSRDTCLNPPKERLGLIFFSMACERGLGVAEVTGVEPVGLFGPSAVPKERRRLSESYSLYLAAISGRCAASARVGRLLQVLRKSRSHFFSSNYDKKCMVSMMQLPCVIVLYSFRPWFTSKVQMQDKNMRTFSSRS